LPAVLIGRIRGLAQKMQNRLSRLVDKFAVHRVTVAGRGGGYRNGVSQVKQPFRACEASALPAQ
jgi:hypothetical protein